MYEQKYIEMIGEKNLQKIINGEVNYNISINKNAPIDQRFYISLQHYLIKLLINGNNTNKCNSFLKQMYNDFYNKPYLFYNSPLLNTKTIELVFGNSEEKNKIINFRNSYYSLEETKKLHIKKNNVELDINEKNRYYAYLLRLLRNPPKETQKLLEKEINKIINTDYQKLSDIELLFYCQYVSNFAVENRHFNTIVTLGEDMPNHRGNQLNDHIFINKKAFTSIAMLTKTVCHETRHSVQYHESYEKDTLAGFELAQSKLFNKYLNTKDYNSYHTNYRYSTIELDAEKSGHWNAGVFFRMFNRVDLAEAVRENRIESTDKRNYYNYMIDENGKALPTDTFIVKNMDEIISKNPDELNNYPLLRQIYNDDGTKKSFSTLLLSKINENFDNRGIYNNYINYGIFNNELDNIPLNKSNKQIIQKYTKTLSSFYRDHMMTIKDYFEDNSNKYDATQVNKVTGYELNIAYKILTNINKNFDLLVSSYENESINNRNPLFDFIYDLRDFKIEDIKNNAIKNNPETIKKIEKVKELCDVITYKFNAACLNSKLNKLPSEVINSEINISDVGTINFKEYFTKYLLPKTDGHMEVTIDNNKYYIGDLIIYYSKIVSNNLKQNNNDVNRRR